MSRCCRHRPQVRRDCAGARRRLAAYFSSYDGDKDASLPVTLLVVVENDPPLEMPIRILTSLYV